MLTYLVPGDERNALSSEVLIERITVVGTVLNETLGSFERQTLSEGSFSNSMVRCARIPLNILSVIFRIELHASRAHESQSP